MRYLLSAFLLLAAPTAFSQLRYENEVREWDSTRQVNLKKENGWLNLAGLFWLKEGRNSFGTAPDNRIIFPRGSATPHAGVLELTNGKVQLLSSDSAVKLNGNNLSSFTLLEKDSLVGPTVSRGRFRWNLIRREDKIGIRLRDLDHPAIKAFKGIERFPADTAWMITAKLLPSSAGIRISNVIGQTLTQPSPGKLVFSIKGITYTLDALQEGEKLFLIFADETNAVSTYASGRYLYASMPGQDGTTILDFNKAFNPPCAFTEFATCLLPTPQNTLPVAITAGEKAYH